MEYRGKYESYVSLFSHLNDPTKRTPAIHDFLIHLRFAVSPKTLRSTWEHWYNIDLLSANLGICNHNTVHRIGSSVFIHQLYITHMGKASFGDSQKIDLYHAWEYLLLLPTLGA
jgi:hypothetical protein